MSEYIAYVSLHAPSTHYLSEILPTHSYAWAFLCPVSWSVFVLCLFRQERYALYQHTHYCLLPPCFALFASLARATPVMEVRLDNLLVKAGELRKNLNPNANQQLLRQQTESKLSSTLHQRDVRRNRMQAELELRLEQNNIELRELNPQIEQEEQTTAQENKQMRELILTLNDALDDKQRQALQMFINASLLTTADTPKAKRPDSGETSRRKSGMGRQREGAGGGGKF